MEQSDQYLPHPWGVPCGGSQLDGGVSHHASGLKLCSPWVSVSFKPSCCQISIQLIGAAEEEGAIPFNGYLWRVTGHFLFETERC